MSEDYFDLDKYLSENDIDYFCLNQETWEFFRNDLHTHGWRGHDVMIARAVPGWFKNNIINGWYFYCPKCNVFQVMRARKDKFKSK